MFWTAGQIEEIVKMEEDKFRCTIFVPVGTSLIRKAQYVGINEEDLKNKVKRHFKKDILSKSSKDNNQDIRKIEWERWRECFRRSKIATGFFDVYIKKDFPDSEINRRKNHAIDEQCPDRLAAELASLCLFYEEVEDNDLKDEIILLVSDTDEGLYCACFLADYLMHKKPYKNHISKVHVERIIGLKGDDSDTFEKKRFR